MIAIALILLGIALVVLGLAHVISIALGAILGIVCVLVGAAVYTGIPRGPRGPVA